MNEIYKQWNDFQNQRYPEGFGGEEIDGIDLTELDSSIAGCVSTFISSGEKLDPERIKILKNCVSDLEKVIQKIRKEGKSYFSNLHKLGNLVLIQVSNGS